MAQRRQLSPARGSARGKIASLQYAVKAGIRQPDDPELKAAYQELAVARVEDQFNVLAEEARKVVAEWPDLTPEQLDRVAGILRGGSTAQNYAPGGGAA